MLFDLRSRGRRRAVKVIYLFLALVMIAGLVLVGVGTGSSGGLLNAFTNGGSSGGGGAANQLVNQQVRAAIKAAEKDPNSAAKWAALMQARWSAAGSGSNYNSTTKTFSKYGKQQLVHGAQAWQQYLKLTNDKPSLANAQLAAGIYQGLGQWVNETNAWNYAAQIVAGSKEAANPLLCLSLSAYAAGQSTKGNAAAAQTLTLTPKTEKLSLQSELKSAKGSASTAKSLLASYC